MTRRKRAGEYAPDNIDERGEYIVGKNRPPEAGRFRASDGRKRGRRAKGTRNLATDLREELESMLTVNVGGQQKRVSRQRAVVMRLADNASRGQNRAIDLLLAYQQRVVEPFLAEEAHKGAESGMPDMSGLTVLELRAMEYLLCKLENLPYLGEPPIIVEAGVPKRPIDTEGQ